MNRKLPPFALALILLLVAAWPLSVVHAQDNCVDPVTGRPIPCPPAEKQRKTATLPPPATFTPTATALPTETPLPTPTNGIAPALPTSYAPPSLPQGHMVGSCEAATIRDLSACLDNLLQQCADGERIVEADPAGRYNAHCVPAKELAQLDLPLAFAPDAAEGNWSGYCMGPAGGMLHCLGGLYEMCLTIGGNPEVTFLDLDNPDNTFGKATCDDIPSPSDIPLPPPPGVPQAPAPTFPPGGWLPWFTGLGGLLIGMLLPVVQKFRAQPKEDRAGVAIPGLMKMDLRSGKILDGRPTPPPPPNNNAPAPQTREHILLANEPPKPSDFGSGNRLEKSPFASDKAADSLTTGRDDVIHREDKDKG
ncbi:MAG: hypothetical protein ACOY0R_03630 [Chloroflexota bacterium]